jgi:hypothetical protein
VLDTVTIVYSQDGKQDGSPEVGIGDLSFQTVCPEGHLDVGPGRSNPEIGPPGARSRGSMDVVSTTIIIT